MLSKVQQEVGRVVSDRMDKTVVVEIERFRRHPLYKKLMRKTKRVKAHDERNECRVGDVVRIVATRPLSREKRWKVLEILQRGTPLEEVAEPKEVTTQ
jgi:small subunit ribosomal protein S17